MPILKAVKLKKTFYNPTAVPILRGIDLEVKQGETVAIIGRSGEGKSTLLHVLGTLEPACSGNLYIANQAVNFFNKSSIRSHTLGFIFQSFHLLEDFTVRENVLMPARIQRESVKPGSYPDMMASQLLDVVGLSERADYLTKLLSGGEKQRTAIARALINNPDIILADEPSGNLDQQTASGIHELLINFAHEKGKTLIVVTHNKELADLCDRRLLLQNGLLEPLP